MTPKVVIRKEKAQVLRLFQGTNVTEDELDGLIDSGASVHVASKRDFCRMINTKRHKNPIILETANGKTKVHRSGDLDLGRGLVLKNCLMVRTAMTTLISTNQLERENYFFAQGGNLKKAVLKTPKGKSLPLIKHGGLWYLRRVNLAYLAKESSGTRVQNAQRAVFSDSPRVANPAVAVLSEHALRRHIRAGHIPHIPSCEVCIKARLTKRRAQRARKPKGTKCDFSCDLMGPLEKTPNGNQYVLNVVCRKSRYSLVEPLKSKESADVQRAFDRMFANLKIHSLHSDAGSEFRKKVAEWCIDRGIRQTFGPRYRKTSNSIVERRNRLLVETSRALLLQANAPTFLWDTAVLRANDIFILIIFSRISM